VRLFLHRPTSRWHARREVGESTQPNGFQKQHEARLVQQASEQAIQLAYTYLVLPDFGCYQASPPTERKPFATQVLDNVADEYRDTTLTLLLRDLFDRQERCSAKLAEI
jgi:hypothetical protein